MPEYAVGPGHIRSRGAVVQAYAETDALTVACPGCGAAVDAYCTFEGRQKHVPCCVRLRAAQKKQETK